jgi:hypothetical protein
MAVCGLLIIAFSGCAWQDRGAVTIYRPDMVAMKRVAVLSFVLLPAAGDSQALPGIRQAKEQLAEPHDPTAVLNEILFSQIRTRPGWRIVEEDELREIPEVPPLGLGEDKRGFFVALGKKQEVEGIMLGQVWRFRERRGSDFAVERAASVAFSLTLFSARDGLPVWKGVFDETQKSLLENLLAFSSFQGRGGRWTTARELASEGMGSLLGRLPTEAR